MIADPLKKVCHEIHLMNMLKEWVLLKPIIDIMI